MKFNDLYVEWQNTLRTIVKNNKKEWIQVLNEEVYTFFSECEIIGCFYDEQELMNIMLSHNQTVWVMTHLFFDDIPLFQGYKINNIPFKQFFGFNNEQYIFFKNQLLLLDFSTSYQRFLNV